MDDYIEPEIEQEVEVTPVHTDDELVAKVMEEQAIERGEIVGKEDDEGAKEEELAMTTREIMSFITKLWKALLVQGDLCVHTAKMLALVQNKIAQEEI